MIKRVLNIPMLVRRLEELLITDRRLITIFPYELLLLLASVQCPASVLLVLGFVDTTDGRTKAGLIELDTKKYYSQQRDEIFSLVGDSVKTCTGSTHDTND